MDFNKYDPLKKGEQNQNIKHIDPLLHSDDPPFPPWMDSCKVIRLIEYLKKHPDQGMEVCQSAAGFTLRFRPGLSRDDSTAARWAIAENVEGLLRDACCDLAAMISSGVQIPMIKPQPKKTNEICAGALIPITEIQPEERKEIHNGRAETQRAFGW